VSQAYRTVAYGFGMTDLAVSLVSTPYGDARVHVARPADGAVGLMMLGHGAGGGVTAHDLRLATEVALGAGLAVALVEQPYRVAGRRAPAPPAQVDAAWCAVAEHLRAELGNPTLVGGGRSFGGRVACRTASDVGAAGVLCLAFPVHPPGRPEKSRLAELASVTVPTLVVQGDHDPFGVPDPQTLPSWITLAVVAGDHSLKKDAPAIRAAIARWLATVIPGTRSAPPGGSAG
jgi:predicted alpha/beta-hydrolase family hydrolase